MARKWILSWLLLCIFVSDEAKSATAVGNFQVQINIQANCLVVSASDLNFGNAGVLSANIDSTSTISAQCTTSTPYTVGLSQGVNGGSGASRQLAGWGGPAVHRLRPGPGPDHSGSGAVHRHHHGDGHLLTNDGQRH